MSERGAYLTAAEAAVHRKTLGIQLPEDLLLALASEQHECEVDGCIRTVEYDDEPWCFQHSPASGSHKPGYSWKAKHAKP
jgi:hypothetical protein